MEKKQQQQGTSSTTSGPNKPPVLCILIMMFGALLFTLGTLSLATKGTFDVLTAPNVANKNSLNSFSGKLEFMSKFLMFPMLWMVFNVFLVGSARGSTKSIDPMVPGHEKVVMMNRILQNSVEQLSCFLLMQVSLLPHLSGEEVRQLIPAINILFLVGRIFFWLGYPNYRSFGFMTTFITLLLGVGTTVYRFTLANYNSTSTTLEHSL